MRNSKENYSNEWTTPDDLFQDLDREFHFTLDAAASDENHKCDRYFTEKDDALQLSWGGHTVFCNPPYSQIGKWVAKAYHEGTKPGTVVVLLIPARTDTKYFHGYIQYRSEIRFVKGRIKFSGSKVNAPFASMIVIFRGPEE